MQEGIQERLDDFIRRKGLRRTGQRDVIVKAAFSALTKPWLAGSD